ncbi:MAG: response regulator, partial [Thermoanaerobaculia bacterium]
MNVLIVDDEEVLQDVLVSLLEKEGYKPFTARTGEEGLSILRREDIDLVLLDLMLPGMSGQDVLRQIGQEDPDQIVVVITDYSSVESAIRAMREGAFDYI